MTGSNTLGIPPLDRLLPGPPPGSRLLLRNEPGVEPDVFLYQAAASHLEAGRDVLYVATSHSPESVLQGIEAYGLETGGNEKRLHFLDAFSPLMGAPSDSPYPVHDPTRLAKFTEVLRLARQDHPDAVVLFDSLSTVLDHQGAEGFKQDLPGLLGALAEAPLSITSFTLWPYEGIESQFGQFDAVVSLRGVEERVLFGQYLSVDKADWAHEAVTRRQLYKTIRPGGVYVYIPKIVVTGPYNAGKSTFIHSVSDTAVSVDRLGTTVALDHGHVTLSGLTADIFGTPGQARFDPILRTIASQALGVIVVVDSTKPESFPRARELMEQTWRRGLPAIIVANKQDIAGALEPQEVAERLGAPPYVKVLGCVGTDLASAKEVLGAMTEHIMEGKVAV